MRLVSMLALMSVAAWSGAWSREAVLAQDKAADRRLVPDRVSSLRRQLLHRFDENGNGRLDQREARQAMQAVLGVLRENRGRAIVISELPVGLRPICTLFDRNQDGVLGPAEQINLGRAMPHATRPLRSPGDSTDHSRGPGKPKPLVRPGDGDDGQSLPPRLTSEVPHQLRSLLLQAFDRNHNERLDPPERCHARRTLFGFLSRLRGQEIAIGMAPPRLGQILGPFDFNGDSKLGALEQPVLTRALKILLRPRPRPDVGEPGDGQRPRRPRPDPSIGEDLDDLRPAGPSPAGGFEVRPGRLPQPDF